MMIYLVTPFENRLAKRGTRFIDIAETLNNSDLKIKYLTSDFSHAYKRHFSKDEIDKDKSNSQYPIEYLKIPGYKKNISFKRIFSNFFMSITFYRYLYKEVKDDDILIIPSRPVDFVYFISKLKDRRKIRLVLDIRDIWPDSFGKKNRLFTLYCNVFLKPSIKKFDKFIHIAPNFQNWLRRYNPGAVSEFIPPGFNPRRWQLCYPKEIRSKEVVKFIFIGALQYQLDILPFIKAIANNVKYELAILGEDGKGQRFPEVSNYLTAFKVTNVKILGVVNPEDVAEIIQKYHIGLIPMITNSFTNKYFDYLGGFLPIFVLGNNDMGDLVKKEKIGWVSTFKVEDIKNDLNQITANELNQRIQNIILNREKYNRDNLYLNIKDLITKICNS